MAPRHHRHHHQQQQQSRGLKEVGGADVAVFPQTLQVSPQNSDRQL